jgi:hypothetical protein
LDIKVQLDPLERLVWLDSKEVQEQLAQLEQMEDRDQLELLVPLVWLDSKEVQEQLEIKVSKDQLEQLA